LIAVIWYLDTRVIPTTTISILPGNGDKTFQTSTDIKIVKNYYFIRKVAIGDLNNDTSPDLIAVPSIYAPLFGISREDLLLLLSKEDGTFSDPEIIPGTATRGAAVLADLDQDDDLDLIVTSDDSVFILPGKGDGSFYIFPTYDFEGSPTSLVSNDFNNDGIDDLAGTECSYEPDSGDSICNLALLFGKRTGVFDQPVPYEIEIYPTFMISEHLDTDQYPDLAVSYHIPSGNSIFTGNRDGPYGISLIRGNGDGTFKPPVNYPMDSRPMELAVGYLNDDTYPDLVVLHPKENQCYYECYGIISFLFGQEDGAFLKEEEDLVTGHLSTTIMLGDVNNDDNSDLLTINSGYLNDYQETVSLFLGNGDGTFDTSMPAFEVNPYPSSGAIGDLDQDGYQDLVITNSPPGVGTFGDSYVRVFWGIGAGIFTQGDDYPVGNSPDSLALRDLNLDGVLDLVTANKGSSSVSILYGQGDRNFQDTISYRVGVYPVSLAVGALDGAAYPDIAVANMMGQSISVILNPGMEKIY